MHILIDLQGGQSASRTRGIGRYSTALAQAIARNSGEHKITFLLNELLPDSMPDLIKSFKGVAEPHQFVSFRAPGPTAGNYPENWWRQRAAELIREQFISDLGPDVVLNLSLFEGAIDNSVTSVGLLPAKCPVATVIYDLIPLQEPGKYLVDPHQRTWYLRKLESLRRSELLLAISDYTKSEAIDCLGIHESRIVTIHSAADKRFTNEGIDKARKEAALRRAHITRKFVMFTSAFEPRKNFEGLVRAFGMLPYQLRREYQLVLVCAISLEGQIALRRIADDMGMSEDELVFGGYVSDEDLVALYAQASLFVLPAFAEGFGLPALEAMACGALAIGSNLTSVPEVIGIEDGLFDPHDLEDMSEKIGQSLTDESLRQRLRDQAKHQLQKYSWDNSALITINALENLVEQVPCGRGDLLVSAIGAINGFSVPSPADIVQVSQAIQSNEETVAAIEGGSFYRAIESADAPRDEDIRVVRSVTWGSDDAPRILLLKVDHIGDLLVSLEGIAQLRAFWPKAHITLVCGPWNVDLARSLGMFDEVLACQFLPPTGAEIISDEAEEYFVKSGIDDYLELNLGNFDIAIDLRYYIDSLVLLEFTDAKYKAGFAPSGYQPPLDLALALVPDEAISVQMGPRIGSLISSVIATFGHSDVAARALIGQKGSRRAFDEGPIVGIAPGTGNPIKAWGRERFYELTRLLTRKGCKIVLFGGAGDAEDSAFIMRAATPDMALDLSGKVPLPELSQHFIELDAFIGNDTSTTHLAAMLGIPTICLFSGQSHLGSWRPLGREVLTMQRKIACAPCHLRQLELCEHEHKCMGIPPGFVASEVEQLLKHTS
ncbi:glycosyltransferase [Sphingobium nicotianae]|uniref:Glycosyltransferase n=1 Tax=Sphingobium nicotianae TaxID=2782607 RepID=A0A9X1IRQ2_9SPHN|nr:glycosyltransferase [Sphingobium nicotianae]MBT2187514.1 glycosyltransferase [Sphingobium nicotianae]